MHVDRDELAALVTAAGADGHDLALRRLLLGGIRNDDAAGGALLGIDALDDDTIVKRTKFHGLLLEIQAVLVTVRNGAAVPEVSPCETAWPRDRTTDFWPQGGWTNFLALEFT